MTANEKEIKNAKQLKVTANEIGKGWEEEGFYHIRNPIMFLEKLESAIKKAAVDHGTTKTNSKKLLEMAVKLKEANVKDGSILLLRNREGDITKGFIELDTFVFDDIAGSKKYFDYMNKKINSLKIPGIGDEIVISSNGHDHLFLISNAFVQMKVHSGEKNENIGIIEKKIMEKAEAY